MPRITRIALPCLAIALSTSCKSAAEKSAALSESCKAAVQRFYAWYVPQALSHDKSLPGIRAIQQDSALFADSLRHALQTDFYAQNSATDIAAIDFDPFLAAQDPDTAYTVTTANVTGTRCRTEVRRKAPGADSTPPDVIPELEFKNDQWLFVDFIYPQNGSTTRLTQILAMLDDERRHRAQAQP